MIRKTIGTLMVTGLLATGANAGTISFGGPTDFSGNPFDGDIPVGDQFIVTIDASDFTTGIFGGDLFISYDTNLLQLDFFQLNAFNSSFNPTGLNFFANDFSVTGVPGSSLNGGGVLPSEADFAEAGANAYLGFATLAGNLLGNGVDGEAGCGFNPPPPFGDGAPTCNFNLDGMNGTLATMVFTALSGDAAEAIATISGQIAGFIGPFLDANADPISVADPQTLAFSTAATTVIPLPAAVWFMIGGLASLMGFRRKK